YLRATLRGGETYRLSGNRGTARYVGLQTMDGITSTTNFLVDELEVDDDGDFEAIVSADEHEGNWLKVEGDHPALILEVEPPKGVYWSYSLGNQWWETIHYGRRQSSLNGHQAAVDSDGILRVVVCSRD